MKDWLKYNYQLIIGLTCAFIVPFLLINPATELMSRLISAFGFYEVISWIIDTRPFD